MKVNLSSCGLSMGPVLFNWKAEKWRDFYFRIADEAPVDRVYVGEAVCSKRMPFFEPHLVDVIERLQAAGKEVVLSTLALVMNKREMTMMRELALSDEFLVEANDVSAIAALKGKPHAIGPYVNVYNEGVVEFMTRSGAVHFTLPVEMQMKTIRALAGNTDARLEVQAFGRLPLALSARCYHARHHNLQKDGCQFVCDRDPDGMDLETLDGEDFLSVNGIQTMSFAYANLAGDLDLLADSGVSMFRLSPHDCDMVAVANSFRNVLDGRCNAANVTERLEDLTDGAEFCNGYLYGREGALQIPRGEMEGGLA